jgi:hypothetical protein
MTMSTSRALLGITRGLALGLLGLVLLAGPARAVTVTSTDTVTVQLDNLQAGSFDQVAIFLGLSSTDPFGPDETFRAQLFDGANSLINIRTPGPNPFALDVQLAIPFNPGFLFPIDNTGFVIIDQILGSFEITGISAAFPAIGGGFGTAFPQDFVVTSVPVPAALPLFGSALAAMGIFRWWRRRRLAAV